MQFMKSMKPLSIILTALLGAAFCSSEPKLTREEMKREAVQTFQKMQEQLFQELSTAMKEGGPVNAIGTCKTVSPEMESALSTDTMKISRVSDKPRNENHMADPEVLEQMAKWKNKLDSGEKIQAAVIETEDSVRILSPIRIANETCLKCHGSNLSADVQAALDDNYPNDLATGYSMGELRGAFQAVYPK